jgi:predicted ATPase/DNA-binding SARP family transcriptional activator
MAARLSIHVLGSFEVLVDGQPAEVSGPRRRALVAFLALHRDGVVTVDSIVNALWGEDLPADPTNAVQHHVTRLRKALGADALVGAPEGYTLRDPDVDSARFEELLGEARAALRGDDPRAAATATEAALALWRGRPLAGLPEADWTNAEEERLDALRLDVLEERFEALLALGEHLALVPELRSALAANPYRERLWRQLMLALYRAGRQADALEAFQEARRVLSDELGLEPGPALQQLQSAILAQDPAIAAIPAPQQARGNLPAPVSSFVGRVELLAEVQRLVREQRLVTLAGPPGVGKTRLALEAARALEDDLGGAAWFVDLRRAEAASDVARLVASAVEAGSSPGTGDPLRRLVQRLRTAEALLVVDECERFVTEVGGVVETVLRECPGVRVLATSREVLRVPGEQRIEVEPLAIPAGGAGVAAAATEAVQLFLERAGAARPGFEAGTEELRLVADICRVLDGLPAAIELAAGRLHVLGPREILLGVERRLAIASDHRLGPDAEGFFEALVGWSYDLLHADEKTLLHQLAVFRGGADRAALLALSSRLGLDEGTVTNLLETLHDKSIVTVSFPGGDARYDLLTIVHEYVLDRLAEAGTLVDTQKAHAAHFAALAETALAGLRGSDWPAWLRRLVLEDDNLWAALGFARDAPEPGIAAQLGTLGWYFTLAERISEGRRFLELADATAGAEPVGLRLELLAMLSYLATEELDLAAAIAAGERGLELAGAGAPEAALVSVALALARALSGEHERALAMIEDARKRFEAAGDEWGAAAGCLIGALIATRVRDVETAARLAAEALRHSRAIGYSAFEVPAALVQAWVAAHGRDEAAVVEAAYLRALELAEGAGLADHAAFALVGLGEQALARGELARADDLLQQALERADAAGAWWVVAYARLELGHVAAAGGDVDGAASLYRRVVEWSGEPRARLARESLFTALAGSLGARALLALAELADEEGAAARLREQAAEVAAGEHTLLEPVRQAQAAS